MREISTDGGWTGEIDFARIVREHKGSIYTVCYMFSKDEDDRKKRRKTSEILEQIEELQNGE